MATIDHTACIHPRTPAGRAACRKLRAGLAANIDFSPKVTHPAPVDQIARYAKKHHLGPEAEAGMRAASSEIKMTGTVARRIARQAAKAENARIQPRRSGARVAVDNSTCVQAALHTSRGLCACGHMTGEFRVAA